MIEISAANGFKLLFVAYGTKKGFSSCDSVISRCRSETDFIAKS